jgi:hypothetical protein
MSAVVRSRRHCADVVGDLGGGHDGVSRPFGCRTIMIAHVCVHDHFSAVGPAGQRLTALPAFNGRDAWSSRGCGSPRSINSGEGKGESLTSPLSIHCSRCLPSPRLRAPPILVLLASLSITPPSQLFALASSGPASADLSARSSPLDLVDGDAARTKRAGERRAVGAGQIRDVPGVDGPAGVGQGA